MEPERYREMRYLILVIVLMMSLTSVYGDTSTPPQTIKVISTGWGSEGIYITTHEGGIVEGCEFARFRLNNDHLYFDKVLSMALSAFHAKSKVVFRVSGCTGNDMKLIAIAIID